MCRTPPPWRCLQHNVKSRLFGPIIRANYSGQLFGQDREKRDQDKDDHDQRANERGPSLAFKHIKNINKTAHQAAAAVSRWRLSSK